MDYKGNKKENSMKVKELTKAQMIIDAFKEIAKMAIKAVEEYDELCSLQDEEPPLLMEGAGKMVIWKKNKMLCGIILTDGDGIQLYGVMYMDRTTAPHVEKYKTLSDLKKEWHILG